MTTTVSPTVTKEFEYYQVRLPITPAGDDTIAFASCEPIEFEGRKGKCREFTVKPIGRAYFSHAGKYRKFTDSAQRIHELVEMDIPSFCMAINERFEELKQLDKNYFIAVERGEVLGILVNYHPISNQEILAKVEEYGLTKRIWNYREGNTSLDLFIKGEGPSGARYGIVLRNGNTGHVSFGYKSYWKLDDIDYTREFPENGKARHLKNVDTMLDHFKEALKESFALEVDKLMQDKSASWAQTTALSATEDELTRKDLESITTEGSALDFMVALGNMMGHRGTKGRIRKPMDAVVDAVQNEVRGKRDVSTEELKAANSEPAPEPSPAPEVVQAEVELEAAAPAEPKSSKKSAHTAVHKTDKFESVQE